MALQRLKEAAEKAKMELSSTTQANISLPFITADAPPARRSILDYAYRAEFESITRACWIVAASVEQAPLHDAGMSQGDIDESSSLAAPPVCPPCRKGLVKRMTGKQRACP